ncbi:hypothetical protein XA68_12226 [Ophiocordyceps unilateralis]|uniref:Uncharacterized protein n=1 Tax=Ophiocordyceps unilateralis TaxID=268505 RepID=A0A2A9PF49_OPHUN|nr:hypothetical protein XA68_12226 [Ophiocordyceps unilateralis]
MRPLSPRECRNGASGPAVSRTDYLSIRTWATPQMPWLPLVIQTHTKTYYPENWPERLLQPDNLSQGFDEVKPELTTLLGPFDW